MDNAKAQIGFFTSIVLHAVAAFAVWANFHSGSESPSVGEIRGMSWSVEQASAHKTIRPARAAKHSTDDASEVAPARDEKAVTSAARPVSDSEAAAPTSLGSGEVQGYLSAIRARLSAAIDVHEPKGAPASMLVLKVSIARSGAVQSRELEKTSGNPEIDQAVLRAFESILPLAPFPESWAESADAPESLTVNLPIEIRPKHF